ncbi:hypothetical protein JXA02_03050 [candidate division KSB1 bacterium]|nr:hypothetical protein [candidate division KSB1 bacterium]RQW09798.1 MAG: hypothetical protein EH222_03385 [candidate division KSB1 bacterium]
MTRYFPPQMAGYTTSRLARFKQVFLWLFITASILFLQLALGTDVKILMLAAATALCGFLILSSGGLTDAGSLVGFAFLFNTLFFAILLKTMLGQSLESNLYAPFTSFLIVFIVSFQVLFALKFAQALPVGKPLFRPTNELRFLKYLAIVCYALGFLLWALSQLYRIDPRAQATSQEKGFGGFDTIYPIFFMGIVAATAFVLISTDNRKSINKWIVVMLATGSFMGLVESRKIILGLTFGYYFFTSLVYRRRLTVKQMVIAILLLLFVFFIFGPAVHMYRNELWFLPFDQRMDYLINNAGKMTQSEYLIDYFFLVINRENALYHYQYFGQNLLFIDRFATIQHNDIVVESFLNRAEMGAHILGRGFDLILPGFMNPNKSIISLEDQITWELGLRKYGVIGFPTVPLIACSFAATKWIGLVFIPLLVFIMLFLFIKKIGPSIQGNVFAIFFIVPILLNAHQWSYSQYIVRLFRIFPVQIILLFMIVFFYKNVIARRGRDKKPG